VEAVSFKTTASLSKLKVEARRISINHCVLDAEANELDVPFRLKISSMVFINNPWNFKHWEHPPGPAPVPVTDTAPLPDMAPSIVGIMSEVRKLASLQSHRLLMLAVYYESQCNP
jgi:hypothetical protein